VIAGADDWVGIERYCNLKLEWLRGIVALPNGIPSHDTFRRVFALLEPEAFQRCFVSWVRSLVQLKVGEVVALDGKVIRRSQDRWKGKEAVEMVSAWASMAGLVLAQQAVKEGSNEIATVPDVWRTLVLRGCIVTVDAANCQTQNARIIVEQGGEYVFALKDNQPSLYAEVLKTYETGVAEGFKTIKHETVIIQGKGHGRLETRRHILLNDPDYIDYFNRHERWWQLGSIGIVERTRQLKDKLEHSVHFFVSSLKQNVQQFADAVRRHWSIENNLH
jgi:predicted transposase YbfD/YdcC